MTRLLFPVLIASLASGACYTRASVSPAEIARLGRGNLSGPIVLRTARGRFVHLDPSSRVRFLRSDGLWTAWVRARNLRVTPGGIFHRGRRGRGETTVAGLPFAHIQGMEVRNLSGGKTYLAVVGSTVLVAAVVLLVVAMAAGKGGGGKVKLPRLRGVGRGMGRAVAGLGRAMARGSYTLARAWAHGWRWYGPDLHVHVHVPVGPVHVPPGQDAPPVADGPGEAPPASGQGLAAPPPPPPASGGGPNGSAAGPRGVGAAGTPGPVLAVPRAETTPLFARRAVRRAAVKFIVSTEGGGDLTLRDGGIWSAYAGLRLLDVFEIGGGARMLHLARLLPDRTDPATRKTQWVGFFRLSGHFAVDPMRRVGLPFGVDVGGGDLPSEGAPDGNPMFYLRVLLGIRVRAWSGLWVALYPFNPTYAYVKGLARQRGYDGVTFPTTLELTFAF